MGFFAAKAAQNDGNSLPLSFRPVFLNVFTLDGTSALREVGSNATAGIPCMQSAVIEILSLRSE